MIVGVSFDTVEEQKAFAESEQFPYTLLADPDRTMGEAYEVLRPADGGLAAFPLRISYLIAPDGTIARPMTSTPRRRSTSTPPTCWSTSPR